MFYSIDLLLETELETVNWREECHLVTVTPSVEQEPNSDRHIHSQGDKKWSTTYIITSDPSFTTSWSCDRLSEKHSQP